MSADGHLSVEQFAEAWSQVNAFPAKMVDPQRASGSCRTVSDAYHGYLRQRGEKAERSMVFKDGTEHHIVLHRGHVVDWTARQFDPEAAVPIVLPEDKYYEGHAD